MNKDPDYLAVAVDWLDAYRASDMETMLALFDPGAVLECGCGGRQIITGQTALREYWKQRFRDYPASDLGDLQIHADGSTISYKTPKGMVKAVLEINSAGLIESSVCGPTSAK